MTTSTRSTTLRRAAATVVTAGALTGLAAAPVQAHDELIGSTPEAGAVLDTAPDQVVLTYSAEVMDIGSQVRVTDSTGASVTAGELQIDGTRVVQPVTDTGAEDETHQVVWRVVSSDGHPIEGTFTYRIGDGADSTTASDPGGTGDTALTGESASGDESTTPMPLWAVAGAGAVLALAVLGLVRLVRGRGTN